MIVFSEYWSGVEVCVLHLSSLSEHKLCRMFRKRKKNQSILTREGLPFCHTAHSTLAEILGRDRVRKCGGSCRQKGKAETIKKPSSACDCRSQLISKAHETTPQLTSQPQR